MKEFLPLALLELRDYLALQKPNETFMEERIHRTVKFWVAGIHSSVYTTSNFHINTSNTEQDGVIKRVTEQVILGVFSQHINTEQDGVIACIRLFQSKQLRVKQIISNK
jgi:predicted butyrate kinase (DUF1464 family)